MAAIETIKVGDLVLSTDPDTLKTEYKPVLETYIRKIDRLVHLIISDEEINATVDYPFYVQGKGFINAGNLLVDDTLVSVNGEDLSVDDCYIEECDFPTTVYNFQVEDYHTYFVSQSAVWVHNANCNIDDNVEAMREKYPVNANGYFGEKGKNTRVIRSDNPESTSIDFYERIGKNGKVEQLSNGHGTKTVLDDGSSIVHRLVTSTKDSPAVSITVTNSKTVKNQKIHFIK